MIINLTKRERATILAALRRWLSYPAAREADSIATNGGKHKPPDNGEIERLCKRITEQDTNRDATHMLDQANNGARERKGLNLRDDIRAAQDGDHFEFAKHKKSAPFSEAHDRACDRFGNGITFSFASSVARKISMDLSRTVTTLAPV
jgi:hypothetical protein